MLKKILYFLLFLSIFSQTYGAVKISKLKIRNNILYCSLKAYVKEDIDMAWILNQGIDLKAKYNISIMKKNKRWGADIVMTNVTIFYQSKKDVINNGYEVILEYGGYQKEYWMSTQEDLFELLLNTPMAPLYSLNNLSRKDSYYIQSQLSITSLELYPPLSIIYQLLGRWSYTSPKNNSRIFNYDSILEN